MSNLDLIIDQKPFEVSVAIKYADDLRRKYKKVYCIVSPIKGSEKYIDIDTKEQLSDIVSLAYYRKNIELFKLHYITKTV